MALPETVKRQKASASQTIDTVMFTLFHRPKGPPPSPTPAATPKGLMRPEPAASLLAMPRRQKLLEHIWQRTSLSRAQFATLYRAPIERYAALVQQFPASESHHHAYPGGMLDHGLEIVAYALKLRQSRLLPVGAPPEVQAVQAEAWTAATAYAALLHDIGKIAVDVHVEYANGEGWHPWHGPLVRPYRFRYRTGREYRLHEAATALLYMQVLDRTTLDWLSEFPELWSALLYVLAGHKEHAGVLGELVTQADQASVAQELGGNPQKALLAPKQALQRKLLDGLRHLVRVELKLNQPQASDGWLTPDALWLVSKTVSDKLRAHLLAQGVDGIPSSNTAVFNVLQDHGIAQATPDGKAIWTATVTSGGDWSHRFTFLRLAPALIWEADERPLAFRGTVDVEHAVAPVEELAQGDSVATQTSAVIAVGVSNVPTADASVPLAKAPFSDSVEALLDLLGGEMSPPAEAATLPAAFPMSPAAEASPGKVAVEIAPAAAASPVSGNHFMTWLRRGIQTRKLIINDARALVHTVDGTAYLVSPGLFQRYAQEYPQVAERAREENLTDWHWVQRQFERLRLHRRQDNGLNIWTCNVAGPRKARRLHGYLLANPTWLFDDRPPDNPYLSVQASPFRIEAVPHMS